MPPSTGSEPCNATGDAGARAAPPGRRIRLARLKGWSNGVFTRRFPGAARLRRAEAMRSEVPARFGIVFPEHDDRGHPQVLPPVSAESGLAPISTLRPSEYSAALRRDRRGPVAYAMLA